MNTNEQPSTSGKMTLRQYLSAIGENEKWLIGHGVSHHILKEVEAGRPIAYASAMKIARGLSKEYEREITPEDIADVKTVNPGKENEEYLSDETNRSKFKR
jgi:hypothetical protein